MQEFSQPSERMSDAEAQDVLRLLAERQRSREEHDAMPTIHDVAMLSNASPEEVRMALMEIRHRGNEELTPPTQRSSRPSILLACLGALLILIAVGFVIGRRPWAEEPVTAGMTVSTGTIYPAREGNSDLVAPVVATGRAAPEAPQVANATVNR